MITSKTSGAAPAPDDGSSGDSVASDASAVDAGDSTRTDVADAGPSGEDAVSCVQLTRDGSRTLFSVDYDQTYHSHHGAEQESLHVFFEVNGLAQALRAGRPLRVLEIGYGTALNALILASRAAEATHPVELVSLEKNRLPIRTQRALHHERLRAIDPDIHAEWLDFEASGNPVWRHGPFTLEVIEGDARETPWDRGRPFDFVWHDAFSPDANQELWTAEFLARVFRSMALGGVLSTYSVKGTVRRALASLGFGVARVPGPPGGKREVLVAHRPA